MDEIDDKKLQLTPDRYNSNNSTSISNCTSEWPLCQVSKYPKATGFVHSGPTQRTSRNVDVSAEQVSKNDIFLT